MDEFIESYTAEVEEREFFLDLTGEKIIPGAENALWTPRSFKTKIDFVIVMEYESDNNDFPDIDSFWQFFTRDLSYIDRIVKPYFASKGIKFPSIREFKTSRQGLVLYIEIFQVEMPNPAVRRTPDKYWGYFGASKEFPEGDKNTMQEVEDFKEEIRRFIEGIKFVEKLFSIPDEYVEIDQISPDMQLFVGDDAHVSFNWLEHVERKAQ